MNKRIEQVQERIKALGLDTFLVISPENRRYLTGFTGTAGWVLITQQEAYFFTDFRYVEQAHEQVKDCQIVRLDQFSPYLTVRQKMEELDLYTMGIESERCTVEQYQALKNQFGTKAIQPHERLVEDIRMVKSSEEIDALAQAEHIGDEAFKHILIKQL